MHLIKYAFAILVSSMFTLTGLSQHVGIAVPTPLESLHVDSSIKIGKNEAITLDLPDRKNRLKFGDGDFVTVGEEAGDDKLYLRYGTLILQRSVGAAGFGYMGIGTETPSAMVDLAGSLRLRSNAGEGKVLTSDAAGNASWQTPTQEAAPPVIRQDIKTLSQAAFLGREDIHVTKMLGNGGAFFSAPVSGGWLYAPLELPDSALITSITFNYIDNNASNNYDFSMRRDNLASNGGSGSPFTLTTSGASPSYQSLTHTFATPYMIRNDVFSFYITMSGTFSGTGDALLKSVVVRYTYKDY